jgi:RND family efflux transporter MFP subunit
MKSLNINSVGAVSAISLILMCGCTNKTQPSGNELQVNVITDTVSGSALINALSYVGVIEENSSVALSFSTMGTIEKIYVSEGDYVSRGQLLAKLDPASANSLLDAAGAALKQAQDGYSRLKSVHDEGSLSEIKMVDIETKLQQARSSFDIAKNNLENCSLFAPASGVIGKKMAQAGENTIIGKTVLTLLDISSVKVVFSVPENEISSISADCRSKITVTALGGKEFQGRGIKKSVSANMISRTYPANITIANPKRELLPGMVCKIEVSAGDQSGVIVVPVNIVQTTAAGKQFVWGVKEGLAKRLFITTGMAKGNGVVVTGGLSAGDEIIIEGYHKVSDGDKINMK